MILKRNKISFRLLLNVMIPLTIMLIVVGYSMSVYMQNTLENELRLRLDSESNYAKFQIENLFVDATSYVKQLSLDEMVKRYLFEVDNRDEIITHPFHTEVINTMNAMEASTNEIFLVWLANESANFYLENNGFFSDIDYNVYTRPWYEVALRSEDINYTEPYIEWITKEIVFSTIQTLTEENGDHSFIVVDVNLGIMPRVVDKINVGKEGEVFIINASGEFIYHKDPEYILQNNVQTIYPEIHEWIQETTGVIEDLNTIELAGETYYIRTKSVGYTEWKIIVLVKRSEIHAGLNRFMVYLVGTLLLMVCTISLIVYLTIKRRLKPIDAITLYSQEIAQGHLDVDAPYSFTKQKDEMGTIARSFVTIAEVFKQKNKMLEDVVSSQYDEIEQQYHYIIEKEKIASLGALVAGVAHEINTPLGNGITTGSYMQSLIQNLNELQTSKCLTKTEFEKIINSLMEASDLLQKNLLRAADLVLQFKTIATNQNIESLQQIDLRTEIENVIASLKPTIKKYTIQIINDVDQHIRMKTYPGAISQVITNFIMNSMHHGYTETEAGTIKISGQLDGKLVRIDYEDDGQGIEEKILEHIFEPFYTTKRSKNNSGLGMFITHNLVNQTLSGTIHCRSVVGQGVKFKITLPQTLTVE